MNSPVEWHDIIDRRLIKRDVGCIIDWKDIADCKLRRGLVLQPDDDGILIEGRAGIVWIGFGWPTLVNRSTYLIDSASVARAARWRQFVGLPYTPRDREFPKSLTGRGLVKQGTRRALLDTRSNHKNREPAWSESCCFHSCC